MRLLGHGDTEMISIQGSVHETENKARLALGTVSRVAVERTSVEAFRCEHQTSLKLLLLSKRPWVLICQPRGSVSSQQGAARGRTKAHDQRERGVSFGPWTSTAIGFSSTG